MSDYFPVVSGQSLASTRWLTEEVFKLIELVQRDEAIYNPRHKYYFCRPYVENFWREVDQKLDKNPGASLAKWTNLRISFRREFTNYLEEQVPPCWSYFDRMFFLHPYLRKKQQQPSRSGDSNLQETLAQISELSSRIERRAIKDSAKSTSSVGQYNVNDSQRDEAKSTNEQQSMRSAEHFFDYYDETEPNNSELDEIIDDEPNEQNEVSARYPQVILELETPATHDKIKSECEDESNEDDYERLLETRNSSVDLDRMGEISMRSSLGNATAAVSTRLGKRTQQQMRLEHLSRLQTRSYHEDLRSKRSRSPERATGNAQGITVTGSSQRQYCATTSIHSSTNVSFVRPTFTKTTDAAGTLNGSNACSNVDTTFTTSTISTPSTQQQHRQNSYFAHHNSRAENFNPANATSTTSNTANYNVGTNVGASTQATRQLGSPTLGSAAPTPHLELCDCKTDPDAMFLMSLLPDIQKLNGRDRGKIKIAFQNILQDYLYPD